MARQKNPYFNRTDEFYDTPFNFFEPFDVPSRPQWLLDLAKKYDVELNPEGCPFQIGALMCKIRTPGYALSIAGSQDGKSRPLLIDATIMGTGKIPISMCFDKGVDTGHARKVTPENIKRFGQLPDGSCGNIIGVGKYPIEKIPPEGSGAQIWIGSLAEVKAKMWQPRLAQLIPQSFLEDHRGNNGWSERRQTFTFTTGVQIRLITYEQKYRKTEGEMAWMIILDEEPPDRNYFISAMEHCRYLRIPFSPINGLGFWSYYDCYLPIVQGVNKDSVIFSCTQYDSPFHERFEIDAKLKIYKDYEIKARVFGRFSEVCGKPFYTYEVTQQLLKAYIPRHTLARIVPMSKIEEARDALEVKMRLEPAEKKEDDVWEIYERLGEHDAYWLSADVAEGNDDPDKAANASVAYVRRLPRIAEGEKDPVMVATLYTHMRNVEFAWMCLYGAVYFNCCLIAPEVGVSADGAVFTTTIISYPYLYRHMSTNSKTMQVQSKIGFDSRGGASRRYAFDLIGTWIYTHMERSGIYHYQLLKEISECIQGKDGRPDHPERGSTDCLIAFGVSEYVRDLALNQIRCNRQPLKNEHAQDNGMRFPNILGMNRQPMETRKVIGSSRGLDQRYGVGKMATRSVV